MARSAVRAATPADVPALRALMQEAGMQLANSLPADLHWKYWQERSTWPGPRSFVLARGDELLAHAAVIPGACLPVVGAENRQRRVRTLHLIDWAARPNAIGAGVSLMKYLGQSTDALLAIGGSADTLRILPHLGFHPSGLTTCYVRPLHPLRILTPSVHPVSRLLPRLARNLLWKLQAQSRVPRGWSTRRIESSDVSRVSTVLPLPLRNVAVFERDEELFGYALTCPIAPMQLYLLEREGRARGYFLLAFALRQARLADCWVDSEEPEEWRALLLCAVREALKNPEAAELAAWASEPLLSEQLAQCGFHARGDLRVQVLAPRNPDLAATTLRLQMLDNDAAFRHGGRNEFWA